MTVTARAATTETPPVSSRVPGEGERSLGPPRQRGMLTRRELLRAAILVAAGVAPTSGGMRSSRDSATELGMSHADLVTSGVARSAPGATGVSAAARGIRGLAGDLLRRLGRDAQNVVCSPYSIAVALAMTRNGALGETAAEMDRVLRAAGVHDLNDGVNALQQRIESGVGRTPVTLDVANSLWAQRDVTWEPTFLDALARYYGAGVRLVDYGADADGARVAINAWTSDRTHRRIPELLQPGVVDALTRLVLVNAVYLKAPWQQPFDEGATEEGPFARSDGSRAQVQMMRGVLGATRYARAPGCEVVVLPYDGGRLAMAVVLPDPGKFDELVRDLNDVTLHRLVAAPRPVPVRLALPRWSFRLGAELAPVLADLGMATAFSDHADFRGMTRDESLHIDAVAHEAFVAVDEAGTEAAAATAVAMRLSAAPVEKVELTVDRPFLFTIYHVETATPLFIGLVSDPSRH